MKDKRTKYSMEYFWVKVVSVIIASSLMGFIGIMVCLEQGFSPFPMMAGMTLIMGYFLTGQ